MRDLPPEAWGEWLRAFREAFINSARLDREGSQLRIHDGWACVRDGRVHVLDDDSQRPWDAVPVFRVRTPGGLLLPI